MQVRARVKELNDEIDTLLCAGDYSAVDAVLSRIKVPNEPLAALYAVLVLTFPAHNKLQERVKIFESLCTGLEMIQKLKGINNET